MQLALFTSTAYDFLVVDGLELEKRGEMATGISGHYLKINKSVMFGSRL
jgi:hypothetical protein